MAVSRASASARRAASSSARRRRREPPSRKTASAPPPGRGATRTWNMRETPSGVTRATSSSTIAVGVPWGARFTACARMCPRSASGSTSVRSTSSPSRASARRPTHSASRRLTASIRPDASTPRRPAGEESRRRARCSSPPAGPRVSTRQTAASTTLPYRTTGVIETIDSTRVVPSARSMIRRATRGRPVSKTSFRPSTISGVSEPAAGSSDADLPSTSRPSTSSTRRAPRFA